MFKLFFTCHHGDEPLVTYQKFVEYAIAAPQHCTKCGGKIASAVEKALAEVGRDAISTEARRRLPSHK